MMNTEHPRFAYPDRPVYIIDGCRTPFLKSTGKPGPFSSSDLAVAAGRALLNRQPFSPTNLDEVILGCVMPAPDEVNIARVVSLRLGCGEAVPAWTVQRNCASGMQSLDNAALNISCGRSDLVLAGGTEAMSHAPLLLKAELVAWLAAWQKQRHLKGRIQLVTKLRPAMLAPVIGLLKGLKDPIVALSMGQTAEILAHRFHIERHEMDAFALDSHNKLSQANKQYHLAEIEPLITHQGQVFTTDTGLREDSSLESLSKLRPVFDRDGLVSAGNSAQVSDGAAWLLLASKEAVEHYHLPVLGQLVDSQWSGLDPAQMGLGPAYAVPPLLQRHQLHLNDIEFWEINEAFAAQVLACLEAWNDEQFCRTQLQLQEAMGHIPPERLNVDGGAIAIGHPVGASGARLVLHLLSVLKRQQAQIGVATLCIGGGQGAAMLISREGASS